MKRDSEGLNYPESCFLEKTRIFTKKKKTWEGRKMPEKLSKSKAQERDNLDLKASLKDLSKGG